MNLIIDPGHGGHDSGAVSLDGAVLEKDIVLSVSKTVRDTIEKATGMTPAMTREGDQFYSLSQRARRANELGANLLSIHANAGGGRGFEIFTSPGTTSSDDWATDVLLSLGKEFPDRPLRRDMTDGDPDKEARFTVLTKTRHSAILVELGFIDTPDGKAFLSDMKNRRRLAHAIARGTLEFMGLPPIDDEQSTDVNQTIEKRVAKLEREVFGG